MANCITCGSELHPERAKKYSYCMSRECQEKNAKGLTMVAIGLNKAAEEFMILDETTRADLASGKYRDQRRGSFGPPAPAAVGGQPAATRSRPKAPAAKPVPRQPAQPAKPWTRSQEKLALLYNEQGQRPDEIAGKLGISPRLVTQIILASRNRGKL
jgi:hypothetical protein